MVPVVAAGWFSDRRQPDVDDRLSLEHDTAWCTPPLVWNMTLRGPAFAPNSIEQD